MKKARQDALQPGWGARQGTADAIFLAASGPRLMTCSSGEGRSPSASLLSKPVKYDLL